MYQPTIREFASLFKKVFTEIILKYRYVTATAVVFSILAFISTYFFTKIAEASSILLDKSSTIPFETRLASLTKTTLIAVSLRYIPVAIFTFLVQLISRDKFVEDLERYMNLKYTKFHRKTPGEIRFTIFLRSLSYPICAQIVIFDFVTIIGTTLFTFIKAYNDINFYAACIFPLFPVLYGIATLIFLKYRLMYNTRNLEEQEKTSARIYDKLSNYDVIKTYNLEAEEILSFRKSLKDQADCQLQSDIFFAKGKYVIRFITMLPYVILGLFSFISPSTMNGKILFQAILLFSSLSLQIKKMGIQISRLANLLNQIRFDSIEEDPPKITSRQKSTFKSTIRFVGVNLYHGETCIVEDINITIRKGERIAVVGNNGTGKSTFIKSILGFTEYTGDILIDDISLKDLPNRSIFSLISYIPQDDFTSDDTVLNNLKLGNKAASREHIESKARLFEAHDAFVGLDNGYDTEAGIKGNRLSGGQKQKISIVRAAVKDAPIFIFDEATAAIDKGYEKTVMEILLSKMKEKTVLMIIHQKDYLESFDKIIFLTDGRVEACEEYHSLIASNEKFKEFIGATAKE
ncbi:uncharacterized protein VICG_02023 [Vittaforma corneae ATCC 50505]|uniref:ABC transporter domain-containing protein n=1 Tax=Vittaforma corneae (strain ATCC 50505) TaxID=993615 RepID=L2GJX2_VITCO|nr:uncharacterized protein VICG_02023 [Vittaforma corneae ATCC 50505]ELA40934.1 hypothetical protein VICG_02023 [Vittaforma corneae ATCC 50505]